MVRTSQCFRPEYSQLDGPRTLAAAEVIACSLIPPASLIKSDRGSLLSRFFSPAQMAFSRLEFSLVHETVPIYLPRSAVSPFFEGNAPRPKPLQGFGEQLLEARRESKFRPHIQGTNSAVPSVNAS